MSVEVLNFEDQQFGVPVDLAVINCGRCGGVYAILERVRRYNQEHGGHWNCPYCKVSWGYSETASGIERLRRQVEWESKRRQWAEQKAKTAEARRRAEKAAKTRLKKRVAAGVCPCCNRTFKQLAAHIKRKHPEMLE